MFNFLAGWTVKSYLKAAAVAAIAVAIGYGAIYVRGMYKEALKSAEEKGRQEVVLEQRELSARIIEEETQENEVAKKELRRIIATKNREIQDLERKLQIEHDLDRLLQAKPGLILKIVQEGTNNRMTELEEITQWED
jgi:uncharacterized protein HemX